jgi:hypothetical protein
MYRSPHRVTARAAPVPTVCDRRNVDERRPSDRDNFVRLASNGSI